MDSTYRTPLLDLFRRGEAPDDVRMLAARGALAPRPHEQLALLVMLTNDDDEGIAMAANETIGRIPPEALAGFLARHDVSEDVREFFRARGIEPAEAPAADADEPLIVDDAGIGSGADAPEVEQATGQAGAGAQADAPAAGETGEEGEDENQATAQRLSRMSVAERIKRAMLGSREERFILVRDVNRLVAAAVLSSPKLNDSDIEAFAKMGNVSEDTLRTIGNSRAWTKRYTVISALTMNPKTPVAVSLSMVNRLVEKDLKFIVRDRNLQEPLRAAARRLLQNKQERKE